MLGDLPCTLVTIYTFCIFGRIILSWFPMEPTGPLANVRSFLFAITEPVLGPLRAVLPQPRVGSGAVDLSPVVVLLALWALRLVLGC